jgi:ferritin-like protein
MAASSDQYHESPQQLSPAALDRHRALMSLAEELEAIDWYDQRIEATGDVTLAEILRHNRDEEKEHASMVLEWLRRNDTIFDEVLKRYLFTGADVAKLEESAEPTPASDADESLSVGALRHKEVLR